MAIECVVGYVFKEKAQGQLIALRHFYTFWTIPLAPKFGGCSLEFNAEFIRSRCILIPTPCHPG